MLITFKKPFKFDSEEVKNVELELDGLRGIDITDTYRQYTAAGNFSAVVSMDPNFTFLIAAASSSKPVEFFHKLPAGDAMQVHQAVQNFLLGSGLVDQDSTAKSEKPASSSASKQKQG